MPQTPPTRHTAAASPPPTGPQLRAAIDNAKTGDKGTGFDPAAAPMEADAEAGGSPPSRAEIAAAHRIETGTAPPSPNVVRESGSRYWTGLAAIGLAVLLFLLWLLMQAPR